MLFIACSLALLVVFSGMKLLAQTRKEDLGKWFKCISWFLIIMGFLIFMSVGCYSTMRYCHKGECKTEKKCKSFQGHNFNDNCQMQCSESHSRLMNCSHSEMACGGMGRMMNGSTCRNKMMMNEHSKDCCSNNNENDCHHEKDKCMKESGECIMKKDTIRKKINSHTK